MQHLTQAGQDALSDLCYRYNLSPAAVEHMLIAVNNGGGSMAQFNCSELGGGGQWMRGGMIMVGDMFNSGLKSTVDNLCNELSDLLANTQVFRELPAGTLGSSQWWPENLGTPSSTGSQNNSKYAVFENRLAVQLNGDVTVYDTLDHQIGGVSQQQAGDSSLTFTSQYGVVPVSSLPVVSGGGTVSESSNNFAAQLPTETPVIGNSNSTELIDSTNEPANAESSDQILALIEKLAQLHGAGVLSDEEFSAKKQELLSRL